MLRKERDERTIQSTEQKNHADSGVRLMRVRCMPDEHGKDPPRASAAAVFLRILAVLCAGAAVWLLWNARTIREEDVQDEERMARLQKHVVFSEGEPEASASAMAAPGSETDTAESAAPAADGSAAADAAEAGCVPVEAARVDFDAVLEEAPDTRAWIRIPGTNIHYPIVQGQDNDFYLTHSPDGALSRAGAIFLSSDCSADFTDTNTILYGHRMNSGTMFAQLHSFSDKAFLDEHPYIYISMPDGAVRTYAVFCVQKVDARSADPAYRTSFAGSADVSEWMARPRRNVLAARKIPTSSAVSGVLTLSTCCRGEEDARLVVQACFIREDKEKTDERRYS